MRSAIDVLGVVLLLLSLLLLIPSTSVGVSGGDNDVEDADNKGVAKLSTCFDAVLTTFEDGVDNVDDDDAMLLVLLLDDVFNAAMRSAMNDFLMEAVEEINNRNA